MTDFIVATSKKLDDPVMQEWAVNFYRDLPKNAHDERARIEAAWFHEFFIAQLLDRGETRLLTRLFRELPPEHFSNLKALIVKNWPTWPPSIIDSASAVLAVLAPEDLLHLYENDLKSFEQGTDVDLLRFLSITPLLAKSNEINCADFVNQLSNAVIGCPDEFKKSFLISTLLSGAQSLSGDLLESLMAAAFEIEKTEYRREIIYGSLFIGLFGDDEFLTMMLDWNDFNSPLRLADLQPFFVQNAPLEQLDVWLQTLPPFEDTVALLESLAQESLGCRSLLSLLRDSTCTSSVSNTTKTTLSIAACLYALAKPSLAKIEFDLPTTVELLGADFPNARWSPSLIEHLRRFDREEVIPALTACLASHCNNFGAAQIAVAMSELGDAAFIEPLILALDGDTADFLADAASAALIDFGNAAQAALIARWDELDITQQIYGLSVIGNIGGQAAADFAVARFSQFMKNDVEQACALIMALPDLRLLELLKPELRRKQALIDRAFYICARLLDYDGPEIEPAKTHALAELKRYEQLSEDLDLGSFPSQSKLFVELECPLCKGINQYEAKGVLISDDPDATFLLNDEFPCASCGQDVEFGFTPLSSMALSVAFLGSQVTVKESGQQNEQFKRIDYKLDGKSMPLAIGLAKIRNQLTAKPNDAVEWSRLGNLLSHLNRPKETIAAFRKALDSKPNAIDATFALATLLSENQQEAEALALLQKALKNIPSWLFLFPFPNFNHEFVDLYNELIRSLGRHDLPALHPSALAEPKKTGRNDPCSCGSGKKFKKCCGF